MANALSLYHPCCFNIRLLEILRYFADIGQKLSILPGFQVSNAENITFKFSNIVAKSLFNQSILRSQSFGGDNLFYLGEKFLAQENSRYFLGSVALSHLFTS
jgi:hypothetical protein